ncbi:hypothetical protein LZ30DRAFT_211528 [Colletotrichum cereale]|nr:hypothetical protein LZ30DRAFT_211528 [Colletotrichum cereale]
MMGRGRLGKVPRQSLRLAAPEEGSCHAFIHPSRHAAIAGKLLRMCLSPGEPVGGFAPGEAYSVNLAWEASVQVGGGGISVQEMDQRRFSDRDSIDVAASKWIAGIQRDNMKGPWDQAERESMGSPGPSRGSTGLAVAYKAPRNSLSIHVLLCTSGGYQVVECMSGSSERGAKPGVRQRVDWLVGLLHAWGIKLQLVWGTQAQGNAGKACHEGGLSDGGKGWGRPG